MPSHGKICVCAISTVSNMKFYMTGPISCLAAKGEEQHLMEQHLIGSRHTYMYYYNFIKSNRSLRSILSSLILSEFGIILLLCCDCHHSFLAALYWSVLSGSIIFDHKAATAEQIVYLTPMGDSFRTLGHVPIPELKTSYCKAMKCSLTTPILY